MTTSNRGRPAQPDGTLPTIDDLFSASKPVRSAEDLARDGVTESSTTAR